MQNLSAKHSDLGFLKICVFTFNAYSELASKLTQKNNCYS